MAKLATAAAVGLLGLILAGGPVAAQTAEDAFGLWLNPENGSNIELYKCGEALCARLVKVTDGQTTDDKNPDPAKRSRPIVGLVIMDGAKKSGANAWAGTLYNRENGKSYSGTITVKSKDAVDLSGCVAVVLCRTATWTRIK
ncbi:MAG TPA: DUF2147 domain-containing protein [Hyphomicrobiaceae bacterium]|nr:DUF2147 domain-containing protein [Hyphomicrobiaceae bacterium]